MSFLDLPRFLVHAQELRVIHADPSVTNTSPFQKLIYRDVDNLEYGNKMLTFM